jgi:hypothetical protein
MSLTSLFEKIAGKQKQREKARVNDFRALVRSIGTGQEPDADQVERVLSDAGRSLDDLRAAVELYQKRFGMRTLVNSLPKLEALLSCHSISLRSASSFGSSARPTRHWRPPSGSTRT